MLPGNNYDESKTGLDKCHSPLNALQPLETVKPGSLAESGNSDADEHWYDGNEINQLLHHILGNNSNVEILTDMLGADWQAGNTLGEQLAQFNQARANRIAHHENVSDRIIIPVNLGNSQGLHWVLLYIKYDRDLAKLPLIIYIDPLGNAIPDVILNNLRRQDLFPGINPISSSIKFQTDGYNCGPWIIEAAQTIVEQEWQQNASITNVDEALKPLQYANINDIRRVHQNIINSDSVYAIQNDSQISWENRNFSGVKPKPLSEPEELKRSSPVLNFVPLKDLSVLNELVNIIEKAKQETQCNIDFSCIALACVQHYLGQTIALVQALKALGIKAENIFMLGKLYSAEKGVYEGLKNEAIQALPIEPTNYKSYEAFSDQFDKEVKSLWQNAEAQLTDKINKRKIKKIIILDDGGKCILEGLRRENASRKSNAICPPFWQAVKNKEVQFTGIEQTSAGLKAVIDAAYPANSKEEKTKTTKELLELTFPVIQVASSALKRVIEPPQIAESFISKVEKKIKEQIDNALGKKIFRIGLIGYGNIGQALVEALEHNEHVIFTVFDKDKAKVLEAEEKRYEKANFKVTDSLKDVISSSDYIFSCTGKDVFEDKQATQIQQIMKFDDDNSDKASKVLYSGSSENIEFLSFIKWLAEPENSVKFPSKLLAPILYQNKNYTVKIDYGGYPFNFSEDEKSVPVRCFQPVLSALFMGVIQGIEIAEPTRPRTKPETKGLFVKLRSQYQQLILSLSFQEQETKLIGKYPKELLKIFNDTRYIANYSAYNNLEYYDLLALTGESKQRPTKDDIGDECELAHSLELYINEKYIVGKENKFESYGKLTILNRPSFNESLFVKSKDEKHENRTYLDQLRECLEKHKRANLFGLGGIGKSYLAIAYSYLYQQRYDIIYWIAMSDTQKDDDDEAEAKDERDVSAIGRTKIIAEYVTLLEHLGVPAEPNRPDKVFCSLKHHLSIRAEPWLLIYDDVADPCQLKDIVPTSGGHIIVTSRYRKWNPVINLRCFQLPESVNYLFSACKNKIPCAEENEKLAAEIAGKLGNLPLALTHAAAYINNEEKAFGFKDYLDEFNQDSYKLLQTAETDYDYHEIIVAITWRMMMRKLEQKNRWVKFVMACCAYLAPNAIPTILFYDDVIIDERVKRKVDDAIKLLKNYSMLYQCEADRSKIDVHCLVQTVVRGELKNNYEKNTIPRSGEAESMTNTITPMMILHHLYGALNKRFRDDNNGIEIFSRSKELVGHMRNFIIYFKPLVTEDSLEEKLLGSTCHDLGFSYQNLGDPQHAKESLERALAIKEKHCGRDHYEVARVLMNLGNTYSSLGDAQQAKALLERALAIQENHYGVNHYKVAIVLANLSNAYGSLGDVYRKKELLERALAIQENHYGVDHYQVAITLDNLGGACLLFGDAQRAKELLKRTLKIKENHYGVDHYQVAITLDNLGGAYLLFGDAQRAKELLERALKIKESYYGVDHYGVAKTLTNLGNAYGDLGDVHRKKELLEHALAIGEKHYGVDHYEVAITLANLGNVYGVLGNVHRQKELLERALAIGEKHYGIDHYEVAKTLANLGNAYESLGDVHREKELLERALAILEKHYGVDHYEIAKTLVNLGAAYGKLGDVHREKELLERALVIKEKHYGVGHYEVALTLTNLGIAYGNLSDVHRKKELLERALAILEKHYGIGHYQVAIVLMNLGNAYGSLGDVHRQKGLLERALPILERHYGTSHYQVAIVLMNLGNAYGSLGDVHREKELLERALAIEEKHYGVDHYEVAITLASLGNAYGVLGNVHRQKELLERALPILEKHYGRGHYEVARTLINLGNAYGDLGDVHRQKELLERALTIGEKHYGVDHHEVAKTLANLSNAYGFLGDICRQKALLERALPILEKHYGVDHCEVAKTLTNLGYTYNELGDAQRAKELLERALLILEKHYGADHYQVAMVLMNLGNSYGSLGDIPHQKALLERALAIEEKHYGKNHYQVAKIRYNLGYTYLDLKNYNQAKKHFEFSYPVFLNSFGSNDERTQKASQALQQILKKLKSNQYESSFAGFQKGFLSSNLEQHAHKNISAVNDKKCIETTGTLLNKHEVADPARAIRYAVVKQDSHILQLLLEKYPDEIDTPDENLKKGYTALHLAVLHNKREHIMCLLQHNARADILDRHGKTAIDYAREKGILALFSSNSERSELELSDNKEKIEEKVIEKQKMALKPS